MVLMVILKFAMSNRVAIKKSVGSQLTELMSLDIKRNNYIRHAIVLKINLHTDKI